MLLTTAEHILDESDDFVGKVPFMQVIVDNAEIEEHRLATTKIACKRIVCSTSNPMPNDISDIIDLIACIDPFAVD